MNSTQLRLTLLVTITVGVAPAAMAIEPIPESPGWRGFLQHEEPTDPVERANWLPAPKGRFYLVTRHYSPRAAILTGD